MITDVKNNELLADLEVSHYEQASYQNILNGIVKNHGYNEEYWKIWEQYMSVRSEYDTLKEHIRVEYIIPAVGEDHPGWWEIDFNNGIITIYDN